MHFFIRFNRFLCAHAVVNLLNGLSAKGLTYRDHQYEPYNRYRILTRGLAHNIVKSADEWH